MRVRGLLVTLALILAAGVAAVWLWPPPEQRAVDIVTVNDVVQTLTAGYPGSLTAPLPQPGGVDYAVLDAAGHALAATADGLAANVTQAYRQRDTVVPLLQGETLVGYVVFPNDLAAAQAAYSARLRVLLVVLLAAGVAATALVLWRVEARVLKPFRDLQGFARRVALGDLDAPLAMDRGHTFGAFTESFDLMRTELAAARERERAAELSKKELVASLSHDIKTPVASIKAVAEVMAVKTADPDAQARLATVVTKADQIDALVTNLFHATLEELDQLAVTPAEIASTDIAGFVAAADVRGLAGPVTLPGCLVRADPLRLAQVIDNVFSNSYKYAGTPITVTAAVDRDGLTLTIADTGPGVPPAELPLVAQKFYRGQAAAGLPGAGLGLYLAAHFMTAMGGALEVADNHPGFAVTLTLPLA
ncbi:MAG: HAMP domain-containing histidine kinase [Propionibacteriaceae bacterium]|nr:HAMP domain-containing histidine kinase [Propionibacteriaceae bacterium]